MSLPLRFGLAAIGLLAYPFATAWLARHGGGWLLLLLFAALAIGRALFRAPSRLQRLQAGLAALLLVGLGVAENFTLKLLPAAVYLSLAVLFGATLVHPPSLIERLVRLQYPDFIPGIAEYLRQLTWLWTGFFSLNVLICVALAALPDPRFWMLYTGVVFYGLMGILVVSEYLYRPRRFPGLDMPKPLATVRALLSQKRRIMAEFR